MIAYTYVTDPAYADSAHTIIDVTVKFDHLPMPVRFTATPDDPEPHGRAIHAAAAAGEYGPVAPYAGGGN